MLLCLQVGSNPADKAKLWAVVERLVQAGAKDGDIYAELYRVYHQEVSKQASRQA